MDLIIKPIPGHEGYLADNKGNIYSYWKKGNYHGKRMSDSPRILKGCVSTKSGHIKVNLRDKKDFVHRLIYQVFNGEIPDGLIVRHINDIANDNRPENLILGTMKDNSADSIRNGRISRGEERHNAKLTQEDVLKIRSLSGIKTQKEIGKMFNINNAYVSQIISRRVWKHV